MLYNRLITRQCRVNHFMETLEAWPEERCSGRTTAIILEAVAKAIRKPGHWIEVHDHYENVPVQTNCTLAKRAMELAEKMNLQFFEIQGPRIRSCHMTNNQLELK